MSSRSVSIGKAAAIKPGDVVAVQVEGLRLAVANANGLYYAVDEMCTHEECSLVDDGILEGTVLTCGCHGAEFDVTSGEVLAAPAVEPLKVYRVEVRGDELVVEV